MKVSRYIIAAILLMIFGCGSGGGGGSSSGTTSAPPSTPISSAPVFAYAAAPSGTFNDEGQYNSIVHTQAHGAVLVYYRADNESINMVTSPKGNGFFVQPGFGFDFTVTNAEADNITLKVSENFKPEQSEYKYKYHFLYLLKKGKLQYTLGQQEDPEKDDWTFVTQTVTDEILYDTPDGVQTVFTGQSANNAPISGLQITVTFTIGGIEYSEYDNGAGIFNNTYAMITSSTINYLTGQIDITFTTAPDDNTNIIISDSGISDRAYASMAIDGSEKVHVSYYDKKRTALMYATNATGAWVTEIADSGLAGEDPGKYSSIFLDGNEAHISYYDWHASNSNGNLKFASHVNGNWTSGTLDTTGDVGLYSYLTMHNGYFYITYYDSDHETIKLISNETGIWKSTTLVTSVPSATPCPLEIDNSGTKHIAYFKNCGGDRSIDLCYNIMGMFSAVPVDVSGIGNGLQTSFQTSFVLDASGKAHISYYDAKDKDLKYAFQTAP